MPTTYIKDVILAPEDVLEGVVEYDMDEQDRFWLDFINQQRKDGGLSDTSYDFFEFVMDALEKEWFQLTSDIVREEQDVPVEEAACSICEEAECDNSNAIVYCDGCNLAVHQDCYGVPYIPEGQWLCRRCMLSPNEVPTCVFCPDRTRKMAFKRTTNGKWVHLLCALWIPEVHIENPVYMEPIHYAQLVPKARWSLFCKICRVRRGACIQCAHEGCYTAFHVSCARHDKLFMHMKPGQQWAQAHVLCHKHAPFEHQEKVRAWRKAEEEKNRLENPDETVEDILATSMPLDGSTAVDAQVNVSIHDNSEMHPAAHEKTRASLEENSVEGKSSLAISSNERHSDMVDIDKQDQVISTPKDSASVTMDNNVNVSLTMESTQEQPISEYTSHRADVIRQEPSGIGARNESSTSQLRNAVINGEISEYQKVDEKIGSAEEEEVLSPTSPQGPKVRMYRRVVMAPVVNKYIAERVSARCDKAWGKNSISKRADFLIKLYKYWTLKRENRPSAPLIRRLQLEPWTTATEPEIDEEASKNENEINDRLDQLICEIKDAKLLRERFANLQNILKLIIKREKCKLDRADILKEWCDVVANPFSHALRQFLVKLEKYNCSPFCNDDRLERINHVIFISLVNIFFLLFYKIF